MAPALSFPLIATRKRSRSHALSGWVDEETGRWRLRGSRESRIMEDAGRIVGAGRHRPVPAARHADKARKATCFPPLKAEAGRGGWHGPSEPDPAGSVEGLSAAVLAGQWHEPSSPHRRDAGTRALPGSSPSRSVQGSRALPWGADPVCPARHPWRPASREAWPPRAYRLDGRSGWMEAFGAGLYLRRLLTPHSVRE